MVGMVSRQVRLTHTN
ncbi:hypothetical protein E2C01_081585 [Portunus trituberculatus]|uniref:Uncharacterized protein n=1 Tax=Portunus trituberculatus TaxID=210409 RepID=A0A5B7IX02_PORTR|nr:hypothetical protein [Portunus trituberculatus]